MDTVAEVCRLAPPPASPKQIGLAWDDIEVHFGVQFPDDFKCLVSLYGQGSFLPSQIQLCNYRNQNQIECDAFINATQYRLIEGDDFPMFPEPDGLLPLAQVGADDFIFWDRSQDPWGFVALRWNGEVAERLESTSTAGLILKLFHHDPDECHQSLADFLVDCPHPPPNQVFESEEFEPAILADVCRRIAHGGERASYLVAESLRIAVPADFELKKAQPQANGSVNIDWRLINDPIRHARSDQCHILLVYTPKENEEREIDHRFEALCQSYHAEERELEIGQWEIRGNRILWLKGPKSKTADRISAYQWIGLGLANSMGWELWVEASPEYWPIFQEEILPMVKSISLKCT